MKTYEIICRISNACGGDRYAQKQFEEVDLNDPDDYIRTKHGAKASCFSKEYNENGQLIYHWDNGSVAYTYELTEI